MQKRNGFSFIPELKKCAGKGDDRRTDLLGCQAPDIAQIIIVEQIPRGIVRNARLRQAFGCLKGDDGISRHFIVNAARAGSGNCRIEKGNCGKKILNDLHAVSRVPERKNTGKLLGNVFQTESLAFKLIELLDGVVDELDFVPRRFADDAVLCEVKDALECQHGVLRILAEKAVYGVDLRDRGIIGGYSVESGLNECHVVSDRPASEQNFRLGRKHLGNRGVGHERDIVAVISGQDIKSAEPLLCESDRSPLGQSVAGARRAVAVGGEQWLDVAVTDDIVIEDLVDQAADIFKNIPSVDEGLIDPRVIRDIKIITERRIIFGIDTIKSEGNLRKDICAERAFGPGGVDLAGGYVFYVVGKGNGHVRGVAVGCAEMHAYGFGNNGCVGHGDSFLLQIRLLRIVMENDVRGRLCADFGIGKRNERDGLDRRDSGINGNIDIG